MRKRWAVVGAGLVVVVVVLLATRGGGSDAFDGTIARGLPNRGMPLRGSLAGDRGAIRDAVQAWADRDDGLDSDAEVDVLWIGHIPDRDVAVLVEGQRVASVETGPHEGWKLRRVVDANAAFLSPGSPPLGTPDVVLLPSRGHWRYVPAERDPYASMPRIRDGLLVADGSASDPIPDGLVLPRPSTESQPHLYATRSGAKSLTPRTLRRVDAFVARGGTVALLRAIAEPRLHPEAPDPAKLNRLSLLWTGSLPGVHHAVVIAQGPAPAVSLGVDDDRNSTRRSVETMLLGLYRGGLGATDGDGPYVAGAYVDTREGPKLVLAGVGTRELHVLVGARELVRPGPVAVIDAPWAAGYDSGPATVVFGRTASGKVAPSLVSSGN